jgi:ribosomal protein S12 methylthiotransferase accessory factor
VAAGPNLEFCVWNALLELIQTDAVAIWHANRLRRPLVDLTRTGDPYLDAVVAVHKRLGRELWVFDVTADIAGVWVFAAISRDCKTGQMVKGFGAHPEASRGLQRAVMECSQMLANVYGPTRDVNEHPASPCEAPLEQTHLLPPGTGEQLRKRLDAYRPGARTIQDLVVELGRKGMDVLVLDMTRPGIGLHTVRVIVPGLRSWFGRLAPGRLYDVPVALGERDGCLAECDLNRVAVEGGGRAEGFG